MIENNNMDQRNSSCLTVTSSNTDKWLEVNKELENSVKLNGGNRN
jgi:hypothetical protein